MIKTDAMGRETENTSKDRKGNILSSTETSYDFYILTLAGLAEEMKYRGLHEADVVLAVGFTWT